MNRRKLSDTSLFVDIDCRMQINSSAAKERVKIKILCADKIFHLSLTDVLERAILYDEIKNQDEFLLYRHEMSSGVYFLYLSNEHYVKMVSKVVWE